MIISKEDQELCGKATMPPVLGAAPKPSNKSGKCNKYDDIKSETSKEDQAQSEKKIASYYFQHRIDNINNSRVNRHEGGKFGGTFRYLVP